MGRAKQSQALTAAMVASVVLLVGTVIGAWLCRGWLIGVACRAAIAAAYRYAGM